MQAEKTNLINIEKDLDSALISAAELFHSGKIFIYPTDTIYGIGGNPFDENVAKKIADLKGRDDKKKFVWLLSDFEKLMNYVEIIFENHIEVLQKIWPAPVTVILNLNQRTKEISNQETAAIRIPQDTFCLNLLKEISRPLISTSVNRSRNEPLIHIKEIIDNFINDVDAIYYRSKQNKILASTIIDLTSENPRLVREGSIKFVELFKNFS